MKLTARIDFSKPAAAGRRFSQKAPQASVRALNRAIGATKVFMARAISGDIGLKSGTVKDELKVREAHASEGSRMRARLSVSGKRIPLVEFGAKGPLPSRGRGAGVTARLKGGRARYPHAFMARMRSGHLGVFRRKPGANRRGEAATRPQLPIFELRGPSLPHVFGKFQEQGVYKGQEALRKNLEHEMAFALRDSAVK